MIDKRDSIPLGDHKDRITADVDREWWTLKLQHLKWLTINYFLIGVVELQNNILITQKIVLFMAGGLYEHQR